MSPPRFALAAFIASLVLAFPMLARETAAVSAPFPIQPLPRGVDAMWDAAWIQAPVIRSASADARLRAEAQLLHDEQALYLRVRVQDATRVFASREAVASGEAHFHDSVEFWIGRHQFALAPISGSDAGEVVFYDYLRAKLKELESQKVELGEDGYSLIVRLPWAILEQKYAPRRFFQFALSFVDFESPPAGPAGRRTRRQIWAPADLKVDRPVTYGAAFLNDSLPVAACSSVLAPFFVPEVEVGAFFPRYRLFLYPSRDYARIAIHMRVSDAEGAVRFERVSRLEGEALMIDLPPGKTAGVERLDFHVAFDDGAQFGPVPLEFFSSGEKPLRDYRSDRRAPEDF